MNLSFLLRRLLAALPTLLGAYSIVFMIPRLVPGDPVALIMQENYTATSYEAIRSQLGLDRPLLEQFGSSLWSALQGDFGQSYYNRRLVSANIAAGPTYDGPCPRIFVDRSGGRNPHRRARSQTAQ